MPDRPSDIAVPNGLIFLEGYVFRHCNRCNRMTQQAHYFYGQAERYTCTVCGMFVSDLEEENVSTSERV